jgi:hypothetical protein
VRKDYAMEHGLGALVMSPYCTTCSDLPVKICQDTMKRVGAILISKSRELMMKHVPKKIDLFTVEQAKKAYHPSYSYSTLFSFLFCLYFL